MADRPAVDDRMDFLIDTRGSAASFGAHATALAFDEAGRAAIGLGDGTVRRQHGLEWQTIQVVDGGVLCLCGDGAGGLLCGGDDGILHRIDPAGEVHRIAGWPGKWVEHVALGGAGAQALWAVAVARSVHLFDAAGQRLRTLDHPSTVSGIAFDAKARRVSASHYNGASLWFARSAGSQPRRLEWKGSHTGIALHPGGDALVTSMQENALHGWRLSDGHHMAMSGYPTKTESLSFSRTGKWLASSGADAVVLWPFFGGGPMGKPPTELAGGSGVLCTRVACHPQQDMVAAGFADGTVCLAEIATRRVLPVRPAGQGGISVLGWNATGGLLALGTEQGDAAVIDLTAR